MGKKILIVGGVAGGASAAARIRRLDEEAEIILFEKGEYISYANCGLPYYIGEVITDKANLVVTSPAQMHKRFGIDVRIQNEVMKINTNEKTVEVFNHIKNEKYTESYDKLVLSPGANPIIPEIPGIDSPNVFTLRNIPDTYRIKDFVDNNKPKNAVIMGAGYIGLEVAENLHKLGVNITVVELADHVIGPLDFEMASIVHQHMKIKNVELYLSDAVKSCDFTGKGIVTLSSGKTIPADMLVMGIGVRPDNRLAKDAGLKIGVTGGIWTDENMRTSDEDIYAVGDAVEVMDYITKAPTLIPLASPANKQGRIAADNICGIVSKYEGTQGTSIAKIFDTTVAITGSNERILAKNGIEYEKSFTHSASHAGYYPGAIPMSIKLIFEKVTGKILGAQIVGYDGVDKRIDVIATAIRAGMTVRDLEMLELAYAPPFSSAKDPVNMAGYVATNILSGTHKVFHWNDLPNINYDNSVLIDVRTQIEFANGSIPYAINIPVDNLRERASEIPKGKDIYIFCQVGLRGYIAYRILKQNGFENIMNLSGGYKTYHVATQKQANEGIFEDDKITKNDDMQAVRISEETNIHKIDVKVNACGLQCPGPILKLYEAIQPMNYGEILTISSTDPAFEEDVKVWCERTGNVLIETKFENNSFNATIRKQKDSELNMNTSMNNDKTLVVFSGDLDKAIASFVIANGAAAMGRKVTMFFTFWGLNVLRKSQYVKTKKDIISRMFGMMMPRGSRKLKLSNMNMGGIGAEMIRFVMKSKHIDSIEELMAQAQKNGVKLIACNMSMDVMGIKQEELIDGVSSGGVATMLGSAEHSDATMFI